MLEYPEGGRNDFVHRLPTRDQAGNITLRRRSHRLKKRWMRVGLANDEDATVTTLLIHLDDTRNDTAHTDLELP